MSLRSHASLDIVPRRPISSIKCEHRRMGYRRRYLVPEWDSLHDVNQALVEVFCLLTGGIRIELGNIDVDIALERHDHAVLFLVVLRAVTLIPYRSVV